ncbi:MAG: hypothetical protein JWP11_3309 [Frankiales bacterium]|nr:hypothetical protein [Frankiales bacterium]
MTSWPARARTGAPAAGRASDRLPVSVIVPVKDEEASIVPLLESLAAQVAAPDEVLVVDGGSRDDTVRLVRARARIDPHVSLIVADGPAGPGQGRNLGARAARNAWIAFTDAGTTAEPTWLQRLWNAHVLNPDARVVYGNYEFDVRSGFEASAVVSYGKAKRATPRGPCRAPSVVSVLLHRAAFEEVGGFTDARSGEDEIFTRAISSRGIPTDWAPTATVWWRPRPDLRSTFQRFRSYSFHYALAGEQRHWHRRLARSYVPVAAGSILTLRSRGWSAVPVGVLLARALVRVHRHSADLGRPRPGPGLVIAVAGLTAVTDAATFLGWAEATRHQRWPAKGTGPARG